MISFYIYFYKGIKGRSELFKLKSIIFSWSFLTDIMHLYFENIVPQMFAHWTQNIFKENLSEINDYELSKKQWESIEEQMDKMKTDMPSDIGRPPRNIYKYHNGINKLTFKELDYTIE